MNIQNKIQHLRSLPKVGAKKSVADDKSQEQIDKLNKDFSEGFKSVTEGMIDSSVVKLFDKLSGYAKDFNNTLIKASSQFENLNKELGISSQQSVKLNKQLLAVSKASDASLVNFKDLGNSLIQINGILPGVGKLLTAQAVASAAAKNEVGSAVQFHAAMTEQLGVSVASANQLSLALLAAGTDSQKFADNLAVSAGIQEQLTGETGVLRDMLEAVGQTSAATRLTFRGNVDELARAALQANRLGTSLAQAEQNADQMLDIESSVGAELEFQQLTGKQILDDQGRSITDQIRLARLTGDTSKIAQLQADAIRSNYESLKGDPLALSAFARSMGMTVDQLAQQNEALKAREQLTKDIVAAGANLSDEQKKKIEAIRDEIAKGELTAEQAADRLEEIGLDENSALVKSFKDYAEKATIKTQEERLETALEQLRGVIGGELVFSMDKLAKNINTMNDLYSALSGGKGSIAAEIGVPGADKPIAPAQINSAELIKKALEDMELKVVISYGEFEKAFLRSSSGKNAGK